MDHPTAKRCIELLSKSSTVDTVDITGGAPELNREFRYLVQKASEYNVQIIDRCNLTVLVEPGQEDLVEFLAEHKVRCTLKVISVNVFRSP
jgi:molybdenum cofactor biosynthesis enzyme MoaA